MGLKTINGLPIVNAKRPIVLKVTARDIAQADRKEPADCAMARACRRGLGVAEARIHLGRVYLRQRGGKQWTRYVTPQALRYEIVAFDHGGRFEPGEYVLNPLPPSWITGKGTGTAKSKSKSKHSRAKETRPRHIVRNVRTGPA